MQLWRRVRMILVIGLLALAVWLGVRGGIDSLRSSTNGVQRATAIVQLLYGVLAFASLYGLVRPVTWFRPVLFSWVVTITLTGLLAPVVWGAASWGAALLGGLGTLVVAGLIAWGGLAHRHADTRRRATP